MGASLVSTRKNEREIAAGDGLIVPSLGSGTSDANTDSITKDYIENGIAEIENFLAEKASEESLVLA